MNTPKTMGLGWGSLVVAAGISFYFAKKSINERRREQELAGTRPMDQLDWKARIEQPANEAAHPSADPVTPSSEPGHDPSKPIRGRALHK